MKDSPAAISEVELQRQREQISRGLRRLNTAAIVILIVVLALAIAAIVESQRSERQRLRAELAEQDAKKKLYETHLARARAERLNQSMGRRTRSLNAIAAAVQLHAQAPNVEVTALRNEAIACLALTDIDLPATLEKLPSPTAPYRFDAELKRYATGDSNGIITLHSLVTSETLARLTAPTNAGAVSQIAFSPDGLSVAAVYEQGSVFHFRPGTDEPPRRFEAAAARTVQFGDDGRHVAILSQNGGARVFAATNEGSALVDFRGAMAIAFHPRSNIVAVSSGSRIRFYNFDEQEVMLAITNVFGTTQLTFRPDGRQIASVNPYLGLTLWDLQTHEPIRLQAPLGDFYNFAYDPTGETITAALGDGVSRVWSTRTGEMLHKIEGGRITAFDRTGTHVGFESPREGIAVGTIAPSPALTWLRWNPTQNYFRRFWSVDFSEDGRWLAGNDIGYLVVWDTQSGQTVASAFATPRRLNVAWLPGQQSWLTANSATFSIYEMRTNSVALGRPRHASLSPSTNNLGQSTLSPDGQTLGIVLNSQHAWLVNVQQPDKRVLLEFHGPGALGHLAFSPDGKQIASSATEQSAILVWNTATGKLLRRVPGPHGRVAFSPDGRQLVLGNAREYSFWDTTTWRVDAARSIARDNLAETTGALTFSPDGKMLAIAKTRQLVQLIDPANGKELASLTAPQAQTISWLRFSPRGNQLAVATFDGVVQLWRLDWLRERLGALNLAWDTSPAAVPIETRVLPRQQFFMLPLAAMTLVLAFVLFAFRRQRHLFAAYLQVEELAAARARELHDAQTEIVHAQKMKALGTLAAGIAHDFNNLLSVIRMSNQLTGEETRDNPSVRENVAEIEQAVTQGKRVVRSMLGYSRQDDTQDGPFALPELVEDTVALLTKQFLSGITLTLELDRDLPPVALSRNRVEQILLNLIVNASESMKGEGSLQIAVRRGISDDGMTVLRSRGAPHYAELSVADSGPGIDDALLPRIFEPFFTTKNRGATRGTGLGLSTVYAMAEQDGLGISVKSTPNEGAEFRIVVPIGVDDGARENSNLPIPTSK